MLVFCQTNHGEHESVVSGLWAACHDLSKPLEVEVIYSRDGF